jgi:cytochrome c553/mono/diheme cytochrome c family protein
MRNGYFVLGIVALLNGASLTAAESPVSKARPPEGLPPDQVRFFETKIRPLLADHCFSCHGPDKQKSNLRLDSAEALRRGGDSGDLILVPGQPDNSKLIKAVRQQAKALRMPPKEKLSDRQIADLTLWVKMGAPFPVSQSLTTLDDGKRGFRPFQAPLDPPLPGVKENKWPQGPLDHFILAQLEAAGLRPAPPADKPTLIRRATFDLIGLPPTPEEIEAFLMDQSPQAFTRVVERLLASPHYGERWGRHWLDVARYADSNGLDENVAHGNAWRYRDYVIAAFNGDKPYDQFVLEQLAGDLLPGPTDVATRNQRLIATGFLSLGPKVLAEVDEKKMEMDIIDEQIDTVGRTFLGLTLGCARCHDHKFDPLSTEDYYALAGIFQSTRTMEYFKKIARWHENTIATEQEWAAKADHDRQVAQMKDQIQQLTRKAGDQVKAAAKPGQTLPKDLEPLYPETTRADLKRLREELARQEKATPVLPSAMGVTEAVVTETAVHRRGSHLNLGKVMPRGIPRVLNGTSPPFFDGKQSGRLQLAQWLVRPDHPLTSRVMVNRLWRWHFGQGLVRSPDNFGKLGEPPANPLLLDWLAHRFVDAKWSVKAMHRLILLSSTYQMSSVHDSRAAERDPDNRLHWRASVRRLEAESIRDALLVVSSQLDPAMGGSLLHVKNRDYLFDHTSIDKTRYDSRRRSVYLPVIRNHLYDLFQLFDFPDSTVPNGDRATTTVAPQALFLLNSELIGQASESLASRLLKEKKGDDASRIQQLYALAYGRPATARESTRAREILQETEGLQRAREPDGAKRRLQAWACLCQIVLAANEFIYVK